MITEKHSKLQSNRLRNKIKVVSLALAMFLGKNAYSQDKTPVNGKKTFDSSATSLPNTRPQDVLTASFNTGEYFFTQQQADELINRLADSSFAAYVRRYKIIGSHIVGNIQKRGKQRYTNVVRTNLSMKKDSSYLARKTDVPVGNHCVYGCFSVAVKAKPDKLMRNVLSHWRSDAVNKNWGVIQDFRKIYGNVFVIRSRADIAKRAAYNDIIFGNTGEPHFVSMPCYNGKASLLAFNSEHNTGFSKCTQAISAYDMRTQELLKVRSDLRDLHPTQQVYNFITENLSDEKGNILIDEIDFNGKKIPITEFIENLKYASNNLLSLSMDTSRIEERIDSSVVTESADKSDSCHTEQIYSAPVKKESRKIYRDLPDNIAVLPKNTLTVVKYKNYQSKS